MQKFMYVDLAGGRATKPFDGMRAGKFTAFDGRSVEFPPSEMSAYLSGTLAAIEATRGESGTIAGLPIDMKNHDHGDAAGWIVNAELMGSDVIRLTSNWTQAGLDLIGAGLQRFFSPSVDMQNKAIIGGSLTNWPATRANGKTLLRPIELSMGVASFETSLDERLSMIYEAFDKQFNSSGADPNMPAEDSEDMAVQYMIEQVFDGYVIARDNATGQLYRATFTEDPAAGVTFQPQAEWVKVKITYEDVADAAPAETPPAEQPAPEAAPAAASLPVSTPALAEMSEAQIAQLVDERVNERIRRINRERDTLALSERLCNGTKESPIGLSVAPADLCTILLSLPEDGAAKVIPLLESITKAGIVNFSERGHSGVQELKEKPTGHLARNLKTWTDAGRKAEEYFSINPELHLSASDFNLSEYQPEDK